MMAKDQQASLRKGWMCNVLLTVVIPQGQYEILYNTSNYREIGVNEVWMWIFEWTIVNRF